MIISDITDAALPDRYAGAGLAVVAAPDGLAVRADLSAALPRAPQADCQPQTLSPASPTALLSA
jgi:hypothetical protein